MENSAPYWKELYFKVYSENRQLRLELESLQQELNEVKDKYRKVKSKNSIKSTKERKNEIQIFHSVDFSHIKTMTQTIVAPKYDISQQKELKQSFCFNPTNLMTKYLPDEYIEENISIIKDPGLNPDLFLFEELFILSVSSNFKSSCVKGRYPNATDM